MNVYIDCEFDSIRLGRKFQQCVVSIGAVAENEDGRQTFYALIHPDKFRRVSHVVYKITQLKADDIMNAPSFAQVMDEFLVWLKQVGKEESVHVYSFGPDDRRTLYAHARYEQYKGLQKQFDVKDIQKILSSSIKHDKKVISTTLSLDDIKYAYALQGDVVHNALNDAIDLMQLHLAYLNSQPIDELHVQEIWERKEAKRKEVEEKQRLRMLKLLYDKYRQYEGVRYSIRFLPDTIEQLMALNQLEQSLPMQFHMAKVTYEQKDYPYSKCRLYLSWHFEGDAPCAKLEFTIDKLFTCVHMQLKYRNASILEMIMNLSEEKLTNKE